MCCFGGTIKRYDGQEFEGYEEVRFCVVRAPLTLETSSHRTKEQQLMQRSCPEALRCPATAVRWKDVQTVFTVYLTVCIGILHQTLSISLSPFGVEVFFKQNH